MMNRYEGLCPVDAMVSSLLSVSKGPSPSLSQGPKRQRSPAPCSWLGRLGPWGGRPGPWGGQGLIRDRHLSPRPTSRGEDPPSGKTLHLKPT